MFWRAPWLTQRQALLGQAAWDLGAVYLGYNLTYLSRMGTWEGWNPGLVVIAGTWLSCSYLAGRYSQTDGNRTGWIKRAGQALFAAICVLSLFIFHSWVFRVVDAATRFRGFLVPALGLATALSLCGSLVTSRNQKRGKKWILAGTDKEIEIIKQELGSEEGVSKSEYMIVGEEDLYRELDQVVDKNIAIGNTTVSWGEVEPALTRLREKGAEMSSLINWCEKRLQRIPSALIEGSWFARADGFSLKPGSISWRVKRLGDIFLSICLLIALAPIILIACLAIKAEDGGPVFYSQTRTGLYGSLIKIWKLRSMKENAESGGIQWSMKGDARITKVGLFIRATRIDELPQLINVIKGDLSLIGPRPERPEIEKELRKQIEHYDIRGWIRPGLSGWAQVCYPYGASIEDSRKKVSYDLYYIRNANILLDLLILIKTIRLVTRGKGSTPK